MHQQVSVPRQPEMGSYLFCVNTSSVVKYTPFRPVLSFPHNTTHTAPQRASRSRIFQSLDVCCGIVRYGKKEGKGKEREIIGQKVGGLLLLLLPLRPTRRVGKSPEALPYRAKLGSANHTPPRGRVNKRILGPAGTRIMWALGA